MKKEIPNLLTLGNLLAGCIGLWFVMQGDLVSASYCIFISLVCDFFDGFLARALQAYSDLGKELDSLADMVSFGLIPGLAMFKMLESFGNEISGIHFPFAVSYLGFFITLFSCLRLAIFNLDEEQKYYFKGLNTPSNTILIFGLYYAFKHEEIYVHLVNNSILMLILTVLSSWLLISPIKMIAMKFKSMKLQDNYPKIALLIGAIAILILFKTVGIPLVIIYYILISLIFQKQLK